MAFWTDNNLAEPLRQSRWYMYFGSPTSLIPEVGQDVLQKFVFALKECSKPEYKIETSSHVLINHTFNYPKNLVWSPIEIKMISAHGDNGDSLAQALHNVILSSGYASPSRYQITQLSKELATFSSMNIIQIDENGNQIENWSLKNAFISNIKYGNLSYQSEDFVDINFTVTYDYATLETLTPEDFKKIQELLKLQFERPALAFGGEAEGRNVILNGRRGS